MNDSIIAALVWVGLAVLVGGSVGGGIKLGRKWVKHPVGGVLVGLVFAAIFFVAGLIALVGGCMALTGGPTFR